MSIKAKLNAALEKIGNQNGHSCPENQDPLVPLLHEYMVCTDAESYFKKRREVAKKAIDKKLTVTHRKDIEKTVTRVKENSVGETLLLIETSPYFMNVEFKNGAAFLDVQALKVKLMKDCKLNAVQVEAIIESCTGRREPSQSWRVVER